MDMRRTSANWKTPMTEHKPPSDAQSALYVAPRQEMVDFIEGRDWTPMRGTKDIWRKRSCGTMMGLRAAYTVEKMAEQGGDNRK